MKNTIIFLMGFSGTGKSTIATAINKRVQATDNGNFTIMSSIDISTPLLRLIDIDIQKPYPEKVVAKLLALKEIIFSTIEELSPPDRNFIFTNALSQERSFDHGRYDRIKQIAERRGATFIPVRLTINKEELMRRVVTAQRAEKSKITDPHAIMEQTDNQHVLDVSHDNAFTLDVSNLSAEDAAKKILDHVKTVQERSVENFDAGMQTGIQPQWRNRLNNRPEEPSSQTSNGTSPQGASRV